VIEVARAGGFAAAALLAACTDDGGPRLSAVMPPAARRADPITISGVRMCGRDGDCANAAGEVDLGREPPLVRVPVAAYSDTIAQLVVPTTAPIGATAVVFTVNERASNALDFEVLP